MKNQFFIQKNKKEHLPSNWYYFQLGNYFIYYYQNLPLIRLISKNNTVGIFLGYIINSEEGYLAEDIELNCDIFENYFEWFENYLKNLGGRFLAIIKDKNEIRLYPDAAASLGIVFSKEYNTVASTPSLIFKNNNELKQNINVDLFEKTKKKFLPFGYTPFNNIQRLIPNHYLNMDNMDISRFYPIKIETVDPTVIHKSVSKVMSSLIKNSIINNGVYMTLTGGGDNRMILACAKKYIKNIVFFTNEKSKKTDIYLVNKIHKEHQLKHRFVPTCQSNDEEIAIMSDVSGFCDHSGFINKKVNHLTVLKENYSFQLTGAGGEISRAFYWKKKFKKNEITVNDIIEIMKINYLPNITKKVGLWLESISDLTNSQIIDLLFWEQDFGCRPSPNMYILDHFSMTPIHLFNHQKILSLLLGAPLSYKKSNKLLKEIITATWPDLNQYPINAYNNFHEMINLIKSYLKQII